MCRMIGYSFKEKKVKNVDFLFEHLKTMSKNGLKSPHNHGWGIATKISKKEVFFHKSITPVFNENNYNFKGYMGIMHSRKASDHLGKNIFQLHPYLIDDTFFCHNGTIRSIDPKNIFGTDSFEYFSYIYPLENIEDLKEKINNFSEKNEYSGINFLMMKDDYLYALCKYKENKEYFTLWYKEEEKGVIVTSEKIDETFSPFENNQLFIIKNGEIIDKINI